ncbi:hypothetical protein B4168_1022 [Anoxybacillus flavithermus]|nr:hypothetical protein B4168_1022 [Anoxybacillus flavithermus]OAO87029.1 hypothetical protein GT23_2047 [Parageobacillus thermoglucosidasius]
MTPAGIVEGFFAEMGCRQSVRIFRGNGPLECCWLETVSDRLFCFGSVKK